MGRREELDMTLSHWLSTVRSGWVCEVVSLSSYSRSETASVLMSSETNRSRFDLNGLSVLVLEIRGYAAAAT